MAEMSATRDTLADLMAEVDRIEATVRRLKAKLPAVSERELCALEAQAADVHGRIDVLMEWTLLANAPGSVTRSAS